MSKTLLKKLVIRIVVTALLGFLLAFANWHWGTVTIDPPLDAARAQWQANPTDANRLALDQAQSFHNGIRNRLLLRWTLQGFVLVTIIWLVVDAITWVIRRVRRGKQPRAEEARR